ncbi:DUF4174 domain-containing protein [Hymenobacter sp. 5516J-16]|uniref:DUF4174 domain-containing protein n=1 Tax=Hymenobacter sp. 5516J-16 TaxID=2932253 RepID=UPI001FD397A3|nr:DUF4174 domain-containing protein [Hymenobacter sp. 5516J-16]UOQ78189.1 DUF4174 domain-containing protein [Hymenobacter sp. 5516J-16]
MPADGLAATLNASKWQQRVLLLCAPTADNAELRRQQQVLRPAKAELVARDVVVYEVIQNRLSAADQRYLRQRLGVASSSFTVLLLGKDGGVKRRETQPLSAAQLFATIDAMPMRQQEMRRPRK